MINRSDAAGWLYERAELCGIEMWGTGAVLDHSTVPKGLYCYDLYTVGDELDDRNTFVSQKSVEEEACIGTILTENPLPFQGKESLSLLGIHFFDEEPMQSLQDITGHMEQEENPMQQTGFSMQEM